MNGCHLEMTGVAGSEDCADSFCSGLDILITASSSMSMTSSVQISCRMEECETGTLSGSNVRNKARSSVIIFIKKMPAIIVPSSCAVFLE